MQILIILIYIIKIKKMRKGKILASFTIETHFLLTKLIN